jgi:DNA-binding phage protein
MEGKFIAVCSDDQKKHWKFKRSIYGKVIIMFLATTVILFFLLYGIITIEKNMKSINIIYLFLLNTVLYLSLILYCALVIQYLEMTKYSSKNRDKKRIKYFGKKRVISFRENGIVEHREFSDIVLSYRKIKRLERYDNEYLIYTHHLMYYIDGDAFEKGDSREFWKFINEKYEESRTSTANHVIANKLVCKRLEIGMSLAEISIRSGIPESKLRKIEAEKIKPDVETIATLAKMLGLKFEVNYRENSI